VVLKYAEALTLELKKGSGLLEAQSSTGLVAAPAGAKPGVAEVNRATIVAKVEKVDAKRRVLLLQGTDGRYGTDRAEYTVGVTGCGKRATYVVMCPDNGSNSSCFAAGGRTEVR
jgi:hypothetical protein